MCCHWHGALAESLGDGFLWGGTAITFLLGQQRRLQLVDLASQVQEDLEVMQIMRAAAPAAADSITVNASFHRASVTLVAKIDAYRELLKQDDLTDSMKAFCERARLVAQHVLTISGVLAVVDPVCAAAPIRPRAESLCHDVEFEPPEEDDDFRA